MGISEDAWMDVGLAPILDAARIIVQAEMVNKLAWRYGLDSLPTPSDYARIQNTQMHSRSYPLLIVQAAADNPALIGTGGVNQAHVFDVEIFLTKQMSGGSPVDAANELAIDLIRYYDATRRCWRAASYADWMQSFPDTVPDNRIEIFCTAAVFGQLSVAKEEAGLYMHSVAFELQVKYTESES